MLIQEKLGNLDSFETSGRSIDLLQLEWFETSKRILHKRTGEGREVTLKFLQENPGLTQSDVVFASEELLIVIDILPCDVIVVSPQSMYQAASLCYEIGNKHLPLFYMEDEILVPYEAPLFRMLAAGGFEPVRASRRLLNPLKTTVSPHGAVSGGRSLFSKILQLTTTNPDAGE
jgi:urease accessory protein